jgi:hypothetical protein
MSGCKKMIGRGNNVLLPVSSPTHQTGVEKGKEHILSMFIAP